MNTPTRFTADSIALKISHTLGDTSKDRKFYCDADGNGTNGDPAARAYGYTWCFASNGYKTLVWLDITSAGILFRIDRKRPYIMCPRGMTIAEIAQFIVSELDRENLGIPDGEYIREDKAGSYRPSAFESGRVHVIEDQPAPARDALMAAWKRDSAAYPLGYSVKVEKGFISGGYGSI